MSDNIKIIADKVEIDDIAEAVREKTGKTEKMKLEAIARNIREMSEAGASIDLDAEITEQEAQISAQDTIIADIINALEGKATDGGNNTKTIHINWSEDMELTGELFYISNGEVVYVFGDSSVTTIEAEYGVVCVKNGSSTINYTSNFLLLFSSYLETQFVLIAKQDGETISFISTAEQI